MGNQSISTKSSFESGKKLSLQNSQMTRLHKVENANLIKLTNNQHQLDAQKSKISEGSSPTLFYLQKLFVTDSQEQYKVLSKYLEKQSLNGLDSQSSELIKIVKIYQQAQKGLCSNHYLIRALFQYSDITIRDQLRVRSNKKEKYIKQDENPYFRYEDLCSIMFACISSLYTVQKMKLNLKRFVALQSNIQTEHFRHVQFIFNQLNHNIPFSLDRIIIMPDGTIKTMHPLLLDHDSRVHYSNRFFYSPQKMRDFMLNDGLKGRLFESALIILQCALIEDSQEMSQIYNGYCVNQKVLTQKIEAAIQIYNQLQDLSSKDMKLFELIRRMVEIEPEKRIGLDECIKEAENLFQLNKRLKESIASNLFQKNAQNPQDRMSIEDLQFIPSYRMTIKASPVQTTAANYTHTAYAKQKLDQKTTARLTSAGQSFFKQQRQNPQVQIAHFNIDLANQKQKIHQAQYTSRNPFDSLLIKNDQQNYFKSNNQECLQSLIGKDSNLYETQKFNFQDSKFEYGKFYCHPNKKNKISQESYSFHSSNKKSSASLSEKQLKYQKLLSQSIRKSIDKKEKSQIGGLIKKNLLRQKMQKNESNFKITSSKFIDNDIIEKKYNFVEKSNKRNVYLEDIDQKYSFVNVENFQNSQNQEHQNSPNNLEEQRGFEFKLQNSTNGPNYKSVRSWLNSTDKKSEVLQKITSQHINQRNKRHKILR